MPAFANYSGTLSVRIERGTKTLSVDIELPGYHSTVDGTVAELKRAVAEIRRELEAEAERARTS